MVFFEHDGFLGGGKLQASCGHDGSVERQDVGLEGDDIDITPMTLEILLLD